LYIVGSTDGSSWNLLDSRVGISQTATNYTGTYTIPIPPPTYNYYRMAITYIQPGSTQGFGGVAEWILNGY